MRASARRPLAPATGLVLLLHAGLLLGLSQLLRPPARTASEAAASTPLLWLLPSADTAPRDVRPRADDARQQQPPAAAAAAPPRPLPPPTPTAAVPPESAAADLHPAPAAPAAPEPAGAGSTGTAPAAAPRAEVTAATPLNLSLPRGASAAWRARHPGLDDPRANSAKATLESRLAGVMAGGAWVEEVVDADHRVFRRGKVCVDVVRTRASQLDPFNQSFGTKPWMVGQSRAC